MDKYSPEFSAYWQSAQCQAPAAHCSAEPSAQQSLSMDQELALEELADRINAARSVI